MIYLLLSIICSVSVGVILKIARNNSNLAFFQMITWNYLFAGILCYWIYKPELNFLRSDIPWSVFIVLIFLLPSIFLIQANSIKYVGIVRTDIAQRLSLILSLFAAYFVFKENFSSLKIIGLIAGLISVLLILSREKSELVSSKWQYPILVLVGFGLIDILFKQIALYKHLDYTASLFIVFCGAFIIALIIVIFQLIAGKQQLDIKNLYWGAAIGCFNFSNILFYLKAHRILHENPSTVFAVMNFGVIILGSFIGIVFFKEKMSRLNYVGLILALLAILLIALSQLLV